MSEPTIFIVDDDGDVRDSLEWLFKPHGLRTRAYPSAPAFLDSYEPDSPGCLLLDMRMPEMTGAELQQELLQRGVDLPVIVLTAYGDVTTAVRSMRLGATDFIEKPYDSERLVSRVREALGEDERRREEAARRREVLAQLATLTEREQQVLESVVRGKASRLIAEEIGLSEKTIEMYRTSIMRKLGATCAADLVRMVVAAEPSRWAGISAGAAKQDEADGQHPG